MKKLSLFIIASIVMFLSPSCTSHEGVEIRKKGEGFELRIDGKPTFITGVGGTNRLDLAAANGANACRTWGGNVEGVKKTVAEAAENGIYVMQGIGLPKDVRRYSDEEWRANTLANVRELAEAFKDDPNIIIWGIGNEIELDGAHGEVMWSFVNELSEAIKAIDTRHLTSIVISHNKRALDQIAQYAPSLDVVGINSYGSIFEVKDMVAESAYQGPYIITEWGPTGWWETTKTEWGAPIEQTSEEKRIVYEERYNKAILGDPRCLGSFVFLWGQKEERTPTWFCMFVENNVEGLPLKGEKTPMVEAMQRVWTGKEPEQTAPVVTGVTINGLKPIESPVVKAGNEFVAEVAAIDREADSMTYIWEVLYEATKTATGGAYEPRPDRYGEVIVTEEPILRLNIKDKGNYRVYAYVADNTGFVSTANSPVRVD